MTTDPKSTVQWKIIFTLFLAPAVVTLVTGMLKFESLVMVGPIAGFVFGAISGAMLGRQLSKPKTVCMFFALGMAFCSFFLCFFGCLAGMSMH